jgi:nitroreductase
MFTRAAPGGRRRTDDLHDASALEVIRAQTPVRRLASDPIDDETVLTLLELASRATAGQRRRCEFVVVRDPDVRHQLARSYRQSWSVYRRIMHSRATGDDATLEARQWEADHFEDVPVIIVACVHGRRPIFSAFRAASFYSGVYPAVQNLLLAATALGLGGAASTLAVWSRWEARRTLGLPAAVTPVAVVPIGRPRGVPTPAPVAPVGNLVHLDRYGHQPFRGRARH